MANKTNPRKRPATFADVEKARREGHEFGFEFTATLQLFILVDKFGWDMEQIGKFIDYFEMYCTQISKGEVNFGEIKDTVKKEYNFDVSLKRKELK